MHTWKKWLLMGCIGLVGYGCGPKTVETSADPATILTEAEITQIAQAYGTVAQSANSILAEPTPDKIRAAYEAQVSNYQKIPGVTSVVISQQELVVTFTKDIQVAWSFGYPESAPLSDEELEKIIPQRTAPSAPSQTRQARLAADFPGSKKMVWINQASNDEGHAATRSAYATIRSIFTAKKYTVDNVPNEAMTLDFMASQLSQYGVIFLNTHGIYEQATGRTWLATGERAIRDSLMNRLAPPTVQAYADDFITYLNEYVHLQNDARFARQPKRCNVYRERQKGKYVYRAYIEVSDEFIRQQYQKNRLPNSLVLLNTCQGGKDRNKALLKAFTDNGANVTLGWDETQNTGEVAFLSLVGSMLGGFSFADAYDQIPNEFRNACFAPECDGYANMVSAPSLTDASLQNFYLYQSDLTAGLVAYFPFEGDATDKSGNNNHGQASGLAYVAGVKGKGAYFHGVQQADATFSNVDKILIKPSASLTFQDKMTISFWIKLPTDLDFPAKGNYCNEADGYVYGLGTILSRLPDNLTDYRGPNVRIPPGFQFVVNQLSNFSTGIKTQYYLINRFLGDTDQDLTSFSTKPDTFLHIVLVFKGVSVKSYENGEASWSTSLERPLFAEAADTPLLIGSGRNVHLPFTAKEYLWPGAVAEQFHCFQSIYPLEGILDEFRIYNRALSAAEIKQLYETDRK